MPVDEMSYGAEIALEGPQLHPVVSNDCDLVATRNRLRVALARERLLVSEKDALLRQREILSNLLGCGADAGARVARLSPRERQIMALVLAGRGNKCIAGDLHISQRTVELHRASIMKKTGAGSLPGLVRFALAAACNGDANPAI